MAVTDAPDPDAGDEIDVLVAVLVDERSAFATSDGETRIEREGLEAGGDVALLSRHDVA